MKGITKINMREFTKDYLRMFTTKFWWYSLTILLIVPLIYIAILFDKIEFNRER